MSLGGNGSPVALRQVDMATSTEFPSIAPLSLDRVCVVIPAFNEEKLVSRCVASVLRAGLAAHQVFVIDDCSSDRTRDVLADFDGIHVISNPERLGKVRGLERAIDICRLTERFEFIALLDADSHVDPMYFDAVLRAFRSDANAVLVCGTPRSERASWITAFRGMEYAVGGWIYKEGQAAMGVIAVAPGCASTYRSAVVPMLDWHGGTLVEDMDLTVQVHRRQLGTVLYAAGAVSHTQDPQRLRDYIGQITRWYSGSWQVMRLHQLGRRSQRIDLEFALLVAEGLIYSVVLSLLPVLVFLFPTIILRCVAFEQLLTAAIALFTAIRLRRADIFFWCPTFSLLRLINAFVWIRTFWAEVIRRQTLRVWFTPERYEGDGPMRCAVGGGSEEVACA